MLLPHLVFILLLSWLAAAEFRVQQRRQFNGGFDASYAKVDGGSQWGGSIGDCSDDMGELDHGDMSCSFSGCRVRCVRGYEPMGGGTRLVLGCDHNTGQLMFQGTPWRNVGALCLPRCAGGCGAGVCAKPGWCECPAGLAGDKCQLAAVKSQDQAPGRVSVPCNPPCQNGGTCVVGVCRCTPMYWGPRCQVQRCVMPTNLSNAAVAPTSTLSRMTIECASGHKMATGKVSLAFRCRRGKWAAPGVGLLENLDVNCYGQGGIKGK